MKKIFNISFVYIGLIIGAGFASGREIVEYFSIPSRNDFSGIIFAALSFSLLCYIIMTLSEKHKSKTFDDFIDAISPKFTPFIKLFMAAFMFSGYFIMLSASGTLFEEAFGLSFGSGVFVLSFICFLVFVFDISGIVFINTLLVPFMVLGMTALCVSSLLGAAPVFLSLENLKSNFLVSGLCYVSYNTITLGAVMVPLSENTSRRTRLAAAILSGSVIGILIFIVWLSVNLFGGSVQNATMPLLTLAAFYGDKVRITYAVILFMALCTTAISHGFGILSKFKLKRTFDRSLAAALLCLFAMPFAKLGFSASVQKVYAAFGFLGFLWTGLLIYKYIKKE